MHRSYDSETLIKAIEPYPEFKLTAEDLIGWLEDKKNIMIVDGDNVGLIKYEYPGVYTGHWFFKTHGEDTQKSVRKMLDHVFTEYGVELIRGLTPVSKPWAIKAAKKIGFKSHGIMTFPDTGDHEVTTLTKEDFYAQEGIN